MSHVGPVTAGELGGMLGLGGAEVEGALLRMEASGTVLRGKFRGTASRAGASGPHGHEAVELRSTGQPGAAVPTQINDTEWCERRLLARIHRLTVATLRKQVEPVTRAQFMRWLMRWQHVAPETQVAGERGVLEVLRQLQGFEIPANAWERQILARRVADYDPKWLDQLCLTGAVGWGRLSPHPAMVESRVAGAEARANVGKGKESVDLRSTGQPLRLRSGQAWEPVPTPAVLSAPRQRRVIPTSVAPITFFVREDADWMAAREVGADESRGLGDGARQVLEYLKLRGASFFADIVRGVGKLKAEIETALWELVAAGLVTADGFDNLRSLIDPKRRAGQGSGKVARPRHSAGRWALLHAGEDVERARRVEAACWMLMRRYGIVVRDLLSREANLPKWREMLTTFRRMEDRGEIRGGRFVDGFLGEQFALPVAVESLRSLRREESRGEEITLSAADPLNLVGILVPGERVPAISGRTVAYRDGVAVEAVSDQPSVVREPVTERLQA